MFGMKPHMKKLSQLKNNTKSLKNADDRVKVAKLTNAIYRSRGREKYPLVNVKQEKDKKKRVQD